MGLKIGHKIILGFGVVIALTLGLGWYQLANVREMADLSTRIVADDFEMLRVIRQTGNDRRDAALRYEYALVAFLSGKAGAAQEDPSVHVHEFALLVERTRTDIDELANLARSQLDATISPDRRELLQELVQIVEEQRRINDELQTTSEAVFRLFERDTLVGLAGYREVLVRLRAEFRTQGARAEELTALLAAQSLQAITDLHGDLRTASLAVLAGVLVVAVLIAALIYRSITRPLGAFMRFVEGVGAGDLTQSLGYNGGDEIGKLGGQLNDMVVGLGEIARQVRTATENLNAAASEMEASVQQHAAGASEQNAAIQQITSTLQEITQSGNQISDRAKSVATSAEATATASRSGLQSVAETSRAIDAIREQAEKVASNVVALTERTQSIGDIITTVKDLSERSNLLALNASIEAAAAGEHGQSFAIVADEMKNLAGQAREATVEVRAILGDIQQRIATAVMQTEEAVKRTESGKQQASATEETINGLTRSVEQSVATFEQIVASMNQQQVGVEQVAASVQGIREASEQMAAGSKDVGRAASDLAALSAQLRRAAERYRL